MRIITSGGKYIDIDAYAGSIAYAELLQKQGIRAKAVGTAPLNESIPPIVRAWPAPIARQYLPSEEDTYTVIDVSEPDYFETFVDLNRIDEIIDHHPGFEEFWCKRIGKNAWIEPVGAACTQVFERWEQATLIDQISQTSARLLMCGILDNTLNFGAVITTRRDHHAYKTLKPYANLPDDWPAQYFTDCQQSILGDIQHTLKNDTKLLAFTTFPKTTAIGQFAIWDAKSTASESFQAFKDVLTPLSPTWFVNAISIGENKSYFISDIPEVQNWLSNLLSITFKDNVAVADRMWLRKEIMKADIDKAAL